MFGKIVDTVKGSLGLGGGDAAQKLKIVAIEKTSLVIEAQFNPETITISSSLNDTAGGGNESKSPVINTKREIKDLKVLNYGFEVVKFDLIYDMTIFDPNLKIKLDETIKNLYQLCSGNTDNTSYKVNIIYGKFLNFSGVITSVEVSHMLFDTQLQPLRTKFALSFKGYNNNDDIKTLDATKSSEDVLTADGAANLAFYVAKKVGTPTALVSVAKSNKLPNLMKAQSGSKIKTPGKKA